MRWVFRNQTIVLESLVAQGQMTTKMLMGIKVMFNDVNADAIPFYGDTYSILAVALLAIKLWSAVFYEKAENHLVMFDNPEEVNRITTNHLTTFDFVQLRIR